MKRIVIFCDGTWAKVSSRYPTNVLIAAQSVVSYGADGVDQITYYDEGVGTSFLVNERLETALAGAFGFGLFDKIAVAYRFLVFNYEPGDEIFIFGFSRGAFTARSLAGLLRKCGIVPKHKARSIQKIFKFYKDSETHPDSDEAQKFRMENSPETVLKDIDRKWRIERGAVPEIVNNLPRLTVKFLGVWDTVGALGIPKHLLLSKIFRFHKKYQFHDTVLSSTIFSARHAVSVDENRLSFKPSLWSNLDVLNQNSPEAKQYNQLWFPGDHGSIGGGGDVRGLSHNSLIWIMEGAMAQGLTINEAKIDEWQKSVNHLAPLRNISKPPGLLKKLLYRRGARKGPQRIVELAESTLQRLEYEAKSNKMVSVYRPKTLNRIHRNKPVYKRPEIRL